MIWTVSYMLRYGLDIAEIATDGTTPHPVNERGTKKTTRGSGRGSPSRVSCLELDATIARFYATERPSPRR